MPETHPPGGEAVAATAPGGGPSDPVRALFVYGTLMPGHLRWPMLAPHATGRRPATARGRLYDSGKGWPVARLEVGAPDPGRNADRPGEDVPGWVVDLRPEAMDDLLTVLDEMEGVDRGLYDRVLVEVDGGAAWAYSTSAAVDALPRIAAWTDQPES